MTARTSAPATLRIWLEPGDVGAIVPERHGELIGSVAVVAESPETAQLRWYLVAPARGAKGSGSGCSTTRSPLPARNATGA